MVSGFLISPNDHERIFSGEASAMRIWSKVGAAWTGLKMFRTSWFILVPSAGRSREKSKVWAHSPLPLIPAEAGIHTEVASQRRAQPGFPPARERAAEAYEFSSS